MRRIRLFVVQWCLCSAVPSKAYIYLMLWLYNVRKAKGKQNRKKYLEQASAPNLIYCLQHLNLFFLPLISSVKVSDQSASRLCGVNNLFHTKQGFIYIFEFQDRENGFFFLTVCGISRRWISSELMNTKSNKKLSYLYMGLLEKDKSSTISYPTALITTVKNKKRSCFVVFFTLEASTYTQLI